MSRMLSLGFFGSHQFRNTKDYFKWLFSGVYRQVHERERNKLWEELSIRGSQEDAGAQGATEPSCSGISMIFQYYELQIGKEDERSKIKPKVKLRNFGSIFINKSKGTRRNQFWGCKGEKRLTVEYAGKRIKEKEEHKGQQS